MTEQQITTIIVDDEPLSRQLIRKLLSAYRQVELIGEYGDGQSAFEAIRLKTPDLVLMDIQMPLMSGIEAVERLIDTDKMPYVIFITAFDSYAIKAFELGAVDYLVKPINKARFATALSRAKTAIHQQSFFDLGQKMLALSDNLRAQAATKAESHLKVYKGEQLVRLAFKDIVWIEALNQYLKIHSREDTFVLSENLSQFSKKLDEQVFVRIHRSTIINLEHLKRVNKRGYGDYGLMMENGEELKLARSRIALIDRLLAASA